MSESRTGQRFPLSLPVKIKRGAAVRPHAATTEDMSAAGVFITTNLPFRKGAKLSFQVTLPAPFTGGKAVEVDCSGRVIRVDATTKGKRRGVACVIDRYRFVSPRKSREAK